MSAKAFLLGIGFLFSAALADQAEDRRKIGGVWQSEGEKWVIQELPDGKIHITHQRGGETLADFDCNSMGRECQVKESGKTAEISMWFSGPKLVMLESKGSQVVKRRFGVAKDADQLQIEIIPIVPPGQPQTAQLKRVTATAESRP